MCIEEIMDVIKGLARSQGFYGRLLGAIEELKNEDVHKYQNLVLELEAQNFKDAIDVVMFFEC